MVIAVETVASPELRTEASVTNGVVDAETASAAELEAALRGSDASSARYLVDGRMLRALRDRKLWRELGRELGHDSFKGWCIDRWRSGRGDAYARINGIQLADHIREAGEFRVPANLGQARVLTESKLGPEKQVTAWALALERFDEDEITADKLRAVVAELRSDGKAPQQKAEKPEPELQEQKIEDHVFDLMATAVRSAGDFRNALPPCTLGGFAGGVVPGQPETWLAWWQPMLERLEARKWDGGDPVNRIVCDPETGELRVLLGYPDSWQQNCSIKVELRAYFHPGGDGETERPQSTDTKSLIGSLAAMSDADFSETLAAVIGQREITSSDDPEKIEELLGAMRFWLRRRATREAAS